MFNFLKSNKTEALEIVEENLEIYRSKNKEFYFSLNPNLFIDNLKNQANFLYSCHGIKNYFSSIPAEASYTIQLECMVFIATVIQENFNEFYEFFSVDDYLNSFLVNVPQAKKYHYDLVREVIHEQIYPSVYESLTIDYALDKLIERVSRFTVKNDWNHILDRISREQIFAFFEILRDNESILKLNAKRGDQKSIHQFNKVAKKIDASNEKKKVNPEIFAFGIISSMIDITNDYISQKLDIDIENIDLDYYSDEFDRYIQDSYYDSNKEIFGSIISRVYSLKDGKFQSENLKLNNNTVIVDGAKLHNIIHDLIFKVDMKPHIRYVL